LLPEQRPDLKRPDRPEEPAAVLQKKWGEEGKGLFYVSSARNNLAKTPRTKFSLSLNILCDSARNNLAKTLRAQRFFSIAFSAGSALREKGSQIQSEYFLPSEKEF
jgi:hypothetical protein